MLKKLLLGAAAAAAIAAPATAWAEGYARVEGGVTFGGKMDDGTTSLDLDTGYQIGAALGQAIGPWDVEGELNFAKSDVDTHGAAVADANVAALFANARYNLPKVGEIVPYAGVGVGYGKATVNVSGGGSDDETGVLWQGMLGGAMPVGPNTAIDLGYRYMKGDFDDVSVSTSAAVVGLRYGFGG